MTGRLVDALTCSDVWAERYDRTLEAVFTVQEKLTSHLAVRLEMGWACQRADDAKRLLTFIRVAAGLDDPGAARALR